MLIPTFNARKFPHESNEHKSLLCQHHLLCWTGSRPRLERDKGPKRLRALPPLWSELSGIGTPYILILVQSPHTSYDMIALLYKDWAVTVWTATSRKNGIAEASAFRLRRCGMDSMTCSERGLVFYDSTMRNTKCLMSYAYLR